MRFFAILLLLTSPAFAKDKAPPPKKEKIQSNNQQLISGQVQSMPDKADDARKPRRKR